MKFIKTGGAALLLLLAAGLFLSSCGKSAGPEENSSSSASTATSSASASPTRSGEEAGGKIDNSDTGVGMVIQEYLNDNIAEIPMIQYDGSQKVFEEYNWKNPVIEGIDLAIRGELQDLYLSFLDVGQGDRIEIRSYPFMDDRYVQIIVSCVIYPETDPADGTFVRSYIYDKEENAEVALSDMLGKYGLTEEEAAARFSSLRSSDFAEGAVESVRPTALFLERKDGETKASFFLEVLYTGDGGERKRFYLYSPDGDKAEPLDSARLFGPETEGLLPMDPPLSYARASSLPSLTIDESGLTKTASGGYSIDGLVQIDFSVLPPAPASEGADAVEARVAALSGGGASDVTAEEDAAMTAKLTFPVWRARYTMGENEDSSVCTDLYFQTYHAEYLVHARVSADHEADYRDLIDKKLASVSLSAEN